MLVAEQRGLGPKQPALRLLGGDPEVEERAGSSDSFSFGEPTGDRRSSHPYAHAIAKVALIHVPAAGHIRSLREVGKALARQGHDVTAWAPPDWTDRVGGDGVTARSITFPDYLDPENPPAEVAVLAALSLEGAIDVAPTLIAALSDDPPDVLVHDSFAAVGRVAAEANGTPRVCCSSLFALGRAGIPPRALPSLFTLSSLDPRPMRRLRAARRELRRQFGVGIGGLFDALSNTAPTTLVCTSRVLQPGGDRFDDRFHFVGPMLAPVEGPEAEAAEPALAELPGDRPLVYLSLGTLRNDRADIYRACVKAVADLPMPVALLMSIGHRVDPAALGSLPPNVGVRPHVDQRAVLERAAVFVTHAGMNSAQEALTAGVPMLCLPQVGDQFVVAARLAQLGAGRTGRAATGRLRSELLAILGDDGMHSAARRLGDDLTRTGGAAEAAELVLAAAGGRQSPPISSPPDGRPCRRTAIRQR